MFSNQEYASKDAVVLLEEIKEQLDRLEASLREDKEKTEKALEDLRQQLLPTLTPEPKTEALSVAEGEPEGDTSVLGLGNLPNELVGSLPMLKPFLDNPQQLLNSPLMKLLPLFLNENFSHSLEVFQKIQEGKLPAPSEILPIAKTFLPKPSGEMYILAESNPKVQQVRTLQRDLEKSNLEFQRTIEKIHSMSKEAQALLEIVELLMLKKQQVR